MAIKKKSVKKLNDAMNRHVLLARHVVMALTVTAYLAFTWSTVVLLGGYVSNLEKKDFWCLTLISLAEATRIFSVTVPDEKLLPSILNFVLTSAQVVVDITMDFSLIFPKSKHGSVTGLYLVGKLTAVLCTGIVMAPLMAVIFSIFILLVLSQYLLFALPMWRLNQRDYASGDNSKATLVPALDIFYLIVLMQGVLTGVLSFAGVLQGPVTSRFRDLCEFPVEWDQNAFAGYFQDAMAKSRRDPKSVEEGSLFSHARELMGTEAGEKYVTGVRVLGYLAKQGIQDSTFTTVLSRVKVQKLILTLGMTQSSTTINEVPDLDLPELREYAARIVAGFADAIHLAQFPGAATCISTLLEEAQEELVVQGLAILDKLALDHHNSLEICSTPGLLPKIMAPICSSDLTEDPKITRSRVVSGTFQVLRGLVRVPGEGGRKLRHEITSNEHAVTNLKSIIVDQGNEYGNELSMLAMEILLELAEDEPMIFSPDTIQNVIKKQLQIFLAGDGEAADAAMFNRQKGVARKVLSLLSSNSENSPAITIIIEDRESVDRLIEILDSKNNINHRIIASDILRNLCKHCALDEELLKEKLLPKVLGEILVSSNGDQQMTSSAGGDDEEQQNSIAKKFHESYLSFTGLASRRDSTHKSRQDKEQSGVKDLQEALLSLTFQLYNQVGAQRFAQEALQVAPGEGAFVSSLKNVVEENCEATPASLRIVKLCCEIAITMLQRNQYTAQFKDMEFGLSVSKASGVMSGTESCILITGATTGLGKNTLRPLLSDLQNKLKELGLEVEISN